MKRSPLLIIAGVALASVAIVVAARVAPHAMHRAHVTYYCPMHPTYTSDRPGDCPICNMRLVPRPAQDQTSSAGSGPKPTTSTGRDLCYMHNCPMMRPGQQCPMLVVAKAGETVKCPICGTHVAEAAAPPSTKKILYWTDPMIPGYKAPGPGKSPMGMELVPVYEEESGATSASDAARPDGYASVVLTPRKQQLSGVKTGVVTRRSITKTIRAAGTVAHDPELYQAEQEFIQAQQSAKASAQTPLPDVQAQAERLWESSRLRLRHLGLSETMINDIATWTRPDDRLLLGGGGEYWVYASIYEYELPMVREGQSASVHATAAPGRAFEGVVKAIDPMVDQATRTTRARILVKDSDGLLKPGMFVDALIHVELGDVLAVPAEAVFDTGTKRIVFVDKGQGVFEPREVVTGAKADDWYEVSSGLSEGEPVVISGNFLIDSESRLKAAVQDMTDGAHQHAP